MTLPPGIDDGRRRLLLVACGAACSLADLRAAATDIRAFAKAWEGRRVVLRQTLYTLMYDERGRLGAMYRGRLEGLAVTTPSNGTYYQFDGRQSEDDIIDRDPNRVVSQIKVRYQRPMHLDVGTVAKITPLMLMQYEPGVPLIVRRVELERDRIRLVFHNPERDSRDDMATSLTVKWPTPLSNDFTERGIIEALIQQFVTPAA